MSKPHPTRALRVALVGLALAGLTLTGSAGATLGADTTVPDSFTVASSFTVTGIPASVTYTAPGGGAVGPGQTSAVSIVDATITANVNIQFRLSGTDMGTLPKSIREALVSEVSPALDYGPAYLSGWHDFSYTGLNGTNVVIAGTAPLNADLIRTELRVTPPVGTPPGSYAGSLTFSFTVA